MNIDFRVKCDLLSSFKYSKLGIKYGDAAGTYLFILWSFTATHRPSGILTGMSKNDILALYFRTNAGEDIVDNLVSAGFLNVDKNGVYSVHDWDQHNPFAATDDDRKNKGRMMSLSRYFPEVYSYLVEHNVHKIPTDFIEQYKQADNKKAFIDSYVANNTDTQVGSTASNAISTPVCTPTSIACSMLQASYKHPTSIIGQNTQNSDLLQAYLQHTTSTPVSIHEAYLQHTTSMLEMLTVCYKHPTSTPVSIHAGMLRNPSTKCLNFKSHLESKESSINLTRAHEQTEKTLEVERHLNTSTEKTKGTIKFDDELLSIEFQEIREYYARYCNDSGEHDGWLAYKSLKNTKDRTGMSIWPGNSVIMDDIDRMIQVNWRSDGYYPTFDRYLSKRLWKLEKISSEDQEIANARKRLEQDAKRLADWNNKQSCKNEVKS